MPQSKDSSKEIDKDALYGWWHKSKEWQDKLAKKAAYMAADVPEDDTVNISRGITWKEIAALGLVVTGGMWGYSLLVDSKPTPPPDAIETERVFDYKIGPIEVIPPD